MSNIFQNTSGGQAGEPVEAVVVVIEQPSGIVTSGSSSSNSIQSGLGSPTGSGVVATDIDVTQLMSIIQESVGEDVAVVLSNYGPNGLGCGVTVEVLLLSCQIKTHYRGRRRLM